MMSQISETTLEILTAKYYRANGINHPQGSRTQLAAEFREQKLGFCIPQCTKETLASLLHTQKPWSGANNMS